jgi:hypothetical protein
MGGVLLRDHKPETIRRHMESTLAPSTPVVSRETALAEQEARRMTIVNPAPPETGSAPALPTWKDAQSVQAYLGALASAAAGVIAAVHPGFTEPPIVQALIPSIATVVAGAVLAVNVITHRGAHKAVAATQAANLVVRHPPGATPQQARQMAAMTPQAPVSGPVSSEVGAALARAQEALGALQSVVAPPPAGS